MGFMVLFFYKESYVPILLSWKAAKIRHDTKNWAIRSRLDEHEFQLKNIYTDFIGRPATMREFMTAHAYRNKID
jgi:MFS transporter, DHA1 family, multidrug resistance protein